MVKRKNAWTMVELMVAIVTIFVITVALIGVYKPNTQKARIYMYSAIRNLTRANMAILEEYETQKRGVEYGLFDNDTSGNSYCTKVADLFSIKGVPNCSNDTSANIVLANGLEIKGLVAAPKQPYSSYDNALYTYKDIVVDIDGFSKGLNRIWVDQFPLRIYAGGDFAGNILPNNCGTDTITKPDGTTVNLTKSTYCGTKTVNYQNDNTNISYDVYAYTLSNDLDLDSHFTGTLAASNLSPMEADCRAYGGKGFFSSAQCSAAGYSWHAECNNSSNTMRKCITKLHKPSGGMNLIVETLFGETDEL